MVLEIQCPVPGPDRQQLLALAGAGTLEPRRGQRDEDGGFDRSYHRIFHFISWFLTKKGGKRATMEGTSQRITGTALQH